MSRLQDLLGAMRPIYAEPEVVTDPHTAHLVVDGNRLLSINSIPGVRLEADTRGEHIDAVLQIEPGAVIENPIHLCIGMLAPEATQRIRLQLRAGENAKGRLLAHCLFPNAVHDEHRMDAEVELAPGAHLHYSEGHLHGFSGGTLVVPRTRIRLGEAAQYFSEFSLTRGRAGRLDLESVVEAGPHAVAEITAAVFGRGDDHIRIRDDVLLAGAHSRGLIKTRVAVAEQATSEVIGITRGAAEGARGHMDCTEIIRDSASARAEPIVQVTHPLAKVTHEAAVGTVDQRQLETLMAHGLTPDEAVDLVITGLLQPGA